ncbi:MAG TPA: APC family permease [Pseudonocardiaceae bacterium]|nr:APC family permease [Pseudonocardiaceae bacterium]
MPKFTTAAKRLLVGRPFRSDLLSHTLLSKSIALPVFASDALSSVAYAPEEIFRTLSVAGLSAYGFAPWIGVVVAAVMLIVVASYRQNVHAYPSGGGDYEVATTNLGGKFGLTVASALMVDYVLTVAVSTSSGIANIGSAVPFVGSHALLFCVLVVGLLTVMNLRGVRESGAAFAIPTYGFMVGVFGMVAWGLVRAASGANLNSESAGFHLASQADAPLAGFAFAFLLLRTFSSGCAALTGVEAISNGVPAFRKPKSKNAATTLLLMGVIAVAMFMGIITLARLTHVNFAENNSQLIGAPADYHQKTLVSQIAAAVFSNFTPAFYYVSFVTGLILVLAANTAFNGFPVLGSILAQDRYLPRQLHTRGDRLAYSNGILFLAAAATVLVVAFNADSTRLIQLYIVGVFVSFTCSQTGMIRHWNRLLRTETDGNVRRRMRRSQTINAVGLCATATVLVIVVVTKFASGAWIAIAAMVAIFALMTSIRRHYDRVAEELVAGDEHTMLPAHNHAVVLVSKLHLPTLRALAYAKATRPDTLTAVTVNVDDADTKALIDQWDAEDFSIPLKVVESPYREITRPVMEYVRRLRGEHPRDVVTVFIPEYVVGHWWEQLLHNQSALRLKGRLLFQPSVMVVSVPWQLASSARAWERAKRARQRSVLSSPGAVRRGIAQQTGLRKPGGPPTSPSLPKPQAGAEKRD